MFEDVFAVRAFPGPSRTHDNLPVPHFSGTIRCVVVVFVVLFIIIVNFCIFHGW